MALAATDRAVALALALTFAGALASCTATVHSAARFAAIPTLWNDPDETPFAPAPRPYDSPLLWDAADHMTLRPIVHALAVEVGREAVNANALDEVADSSWFTNRLSRRVLTPDEVSEGPCAESGPLPSGAWTVVEAKPNGWSPGFVARGSDGVRYLMKADGVRQGEQPTAADVIGSRVYWAAGFSVPCNRIVEVPASMLAIAPGTQYEDDQGRRHPFDRAKLDEILARAVRLPDGRYRFGASRFVDGTPLGPFRYEDVRADDPNDVVPHEDRRELRGSRLLAAWLLHFDAREQNSLTTWVGDPHGAGYVKHWLIDFADCMGGLWAIDAMSRRMGSSGYFSVDHIAADWLTLGLIERPWDRATMDPSAPIFGYFRVADFDPEQWRDGYPVPAFDRMTERDGAWMARIVARFTDAHLHALVAQAQFTRDVYGEHLVRVLAGRRDRVLARYLTRLSPLADVVLDEGRVCANDRAREANTGPAVTYRATSNGASLDVAVDGARVCVALPSNARSDYRVVTVWRVPDRAPPMRVHLARGGDAQWMVAGVER